MGIKIKTKKIFLSFICLSILICFAAFASAVTCSSCSDCNSKIASASQGATISLNESISGQVGTCIQINRDDITFDCQNNVIDGDDSGTDYGVYVNAYSNGNLTGITITNCVIKDFRTGIYLYGGSTKKVNDSTITNVNCSSNTNYGIYLTYSDNIDMTNIISSYNGNGLYLGYTNVGSLQNINVSNSGYGINLYRADNYNFNNMNISDNSGYGIMMGNFNDNNIFTDIISNNNRDGFYLTYSNNNSFQNITTSYNDNQGVRIDGFSINNNFQDVETKENKFYDIYLATSSNPSYCSNEFSNVIGSGDRAIIVVTNTSANIADTTLSELILCNADDSQITNVTINGSSSYTNNGMFLYYVDNSTFSDITSNANRDGIWLYSYSGSDTADYNTFENIVANDNYGSSVPAFYFNHADHNTVNNINTSNLYGGIKLSNSNFNIFQNINASNNIHREGFLITYSHSNNIQNLISNSNGYGISILYSDFNILQNINTSGNSLYGIQLNNADHNNITTVNTSSNAREGVFLSASNSNIIRFADVFYNTWNGIALGSGSNNNYFEEITASYNSWDGIAMTSSQLNHFKDIIVKDMNFYRTKK